MKNLAEKKQVTSVTFRVKRLKNRVSGKFKKGGQKLLSNSILCTIGCNDESNYTIYAGVKATLVEINEKIIENPNIVAQEPWADGYIAILLPNINAAKSLKESLLSYDAYKTIVDRRHQSVQNALLEAMDPVIA